MMSSAPDALVTKNNRSRAVISAGARVRGQHVDVQGAQVAEERPEPFDVFVESGHGRLLQHDH